MKQLRFLSLALLIMALFSCQKENSNNDPDPNPNPDPVPVSTTEIGSQGGEFFYEDFSLVVPEGCFNGYFELELLEYPAQSMYGENEASTYYSLSGIPVEFLEPVELTLESEAGGDLFAVVGQDVKAVSSPSAGIAFSFRDVTKNGNKYSFTLDATDIPNYATDDTISIVIGLVKDYVKIETKANFTVYAPAVNANEAMDLKQYLEKAYSKFESTAIKFSYEKRTKWPVQVTVRKLSSGTFGYFVPSKWGDNYGYMEFNQDYLSDKTELRVTAGHEFFHLVQAFYDPRYGFTKAISSSDYYWVEEAASVWAEGLFSDVPDYCSPIRNGHQMAPFKGFNVGAEENAQFHGYGMSAFIKYMVETYGEDKLVKIFEHELSGSSNIVQGFNNALSDPLSEIYPAFLLEYIQGNIYSDFGAVNLLGELSGTFNINGASDTLKTFEASFPELSAKVYKIDINHNGFTDQNSLLIKTDNTKKLVFKLKGSELTLLGNVFGDYTVTNLAGIQQENALILVVAVNHHYYEEEGTIEFRVNKTPPLPIEGCRFTLKNLPAVEHVIKPDGSTMSQNITYDYTFDDDYYRPGTYSNGNFYASWDEVDGGWRHIGNMHLIIDEQGRRIVSGSIEAGIESVNNPTTTYDKMEITFSDVPTSSWGSSTIYFALTGDAFCNPAHVSHFDESSAQLNWYRSLLSYSCSGSTQFVIKLSLAD